MQLDDPPTGSRSTVLPLRHTTDPATCLMVYKNHWDQAVAIMNQTLSRVGGKRRTQLEDIEAVTHYVDQMMLLVVEEYAENGGHGPVLEYTLGNDIFEKLFVWSSQESDDSTRMKLHALKMYEFVIGQTRQTLLVHKPIIRPLIKLLVSCDCQRHPNESVESQLIQVLHQLAVCLSRDTQVLELLFNAGSDHGTTKFVMFSLLIPYVHREGSIGQRARDALLLIMALSSKHNDIGQYIAENSDFCPVLATGLSGRYSELPRKFDMPSDDWHQLRPDDIDSMPDLIMFLNSLEFCNAVVQVAHPLVKEQLLMYIYNGFLESVLGPALHQSVISKSSMDEVIAVTAYLELFIRRITEPALMRIFLQFLITGQHDGMVILESLISRMSGGSRLCMVSLSLFTTLVDLHCEDLMFQLVFRYLIPCTHVMVSQRRSVRHVDMYGKTAEKLLSLTPTCCRATAATHRQTAVPPEGASISATRSPSNGISSTAHTANTPLPMLPNSTKTKRSFFRRKPKSPNPVYSHESQIGVSCTEIPKPSQRSDSLIIGGDNGCKSRFENTYLQYLASAHEAVQRCAIDTHHWSAPYDGENPPPGSPVSTNVAVTHTSGASQTLTADDHVAKSNLASSNYNSSHDNYSEKTISNRQPNGTSDSGEGSKEISNRNDAERDNICDQTSRIEFVVINEDRNLTAVGDSDRMLKGSDTFDKTSHVVDGYAESVTSEADSALSGESSAADNLHVPNEDIQRNDSPMNDNFDNADFHAFLLSLRSVKTPVEFCEDIEASLTEMDSLIRDFEQPIVDAAASENCTGSTVVTNLHEETRVDSRPKHSLRTNICEANTTTEVLEKQADALDTIGIDTGGAGDASITIAQWLKPSVGHQGAALTPTKYNFGTPSIGPFLSTLLQKLEGLMQNSLYVNLLCTGLIARLAAYPQPLLRSLLLNHTLVFQPTVKSLIQVLGSVKHKLDCFAYSVNDFDKLMEKARNFLAWREGGAICDPSGAVQKSNTPPPGGAAETHSNKDRRSTFGDFFSRCNSLTTMRDWSKGRSSPRFPQVNRHARGSSPQPPEGAVSSRETLKTKNAVYCALILEEFMKELAALSQEHTVLNLQSNMSWSQF